MAPRRDRRDDFPLASVSLYGPDDRTVTKVATGILVRPDAEEPSALERWAGPSVHRGPAEAAREAFARRHRARLAVVTTRVCGCPHEEARRGPARRGGTARPRRPARRGTGAEAAGRGGLRSEGLEAPETTNA